MQASASIRNPGLHENIDSHVADAAASTEGYPSERSTRLAELLMKATVLWHQKHAGKAPNKATSTNAEHTENLSPREEHILRGLEMIGPTNPARLATYCKIPLPTLQRDLKFLLTKGLILKEGQTRGVSYTLPKHKKCYG